jgi:hypothetical protein
MNQAVQTSTVPKVNDHLVLLGGMSSAGKSASFRNMRDPEGVMYLNCESGKKLPFKSKFQEFTITDPHQIYEAFTVAESRPHVHTIIIDSLTYMLDMYESLFVRPATDSRKAWGDFAQFFQVLMMQYVAKSTKNVIFTAHTLETMNEATFKMDTKVPVKGALKNSGIESWFSCIIAAKKVTLKDLEGYESDGLTIDEEDEDLQMKYVYQTRLTRDTVGERLRGPTGLWKRSETFINNDMQYVLDRLHTYFA